MPIAMAHALAGPTSASTKCLELDVRAARALRLRAHLASGEEVGVDLPRARCCGTATGCASADGRDRRGRGGARAAAGGALRGRRARARAHRVPRRQPPRADPGRRRLAAAAARPRAARDDRAAGRARAEVEDGFQPESGAYGHRHVHHSARRPGGHAFDAGDGDAHGHPRPRIDDHVHGATHDHGDPHDHVHERTTTTTATHGAPAAEAGRDARRHDALHLASPRCRSAATATRAGSSGRSSRARSPTRRARAGVDRDVLALSIASFEGR
jgi:hypothetical protein